jgi:hypothetical protein
VCPVQYRALPKAAHGTLPPVCPQHLASKVGLEETGPSLGDTRPSLEDPVKVIGYRLGLIESACFPLIKV